MINSMTAFARTQIQGEWGSLICEMRSINHRYLEISLHLPEQLRTFEMAIREIIKTQVKRGKIECTLRYQYRVKEQAMFMVNTALAEELCAASEEIASFLRQPGLVNPTDILRFPGVLESKEADLSLLQPYVLEVVQKTTQELMSCRCREGEDLKHLFIERLDGMEKELSKVKQQMPTVLKEQRERLYKRFTDAQLELDPTRLEQEMVMFAQRIDVSEEIDRLETHINEIRRVLKQGGVIGRRLDFLLQELNREANTMGSKSFDTIITHAAVELKVLIEQIREQVQNLE